MIDSIPRWKFGMWNFSLGACRLSSGRPNPIITRGNLQVRFEVADDGNRAAGADEDRVLLEDVVQRFGGGLDVWIVGADDDGVALDEAP